MNNKTKILVVEDEEAIRTGLVDVLVFHGYDVDIAESGDVGLQKALSGRYQLILLDVMLPKVNGFDICNQVRDEDKNTPIIMLTAKSSDEDIIHGLKLGADDYVAKPFSVAQLVLRIQAVLRRTAPQSDDSESIVLLDGAHIDVANLSGKANDEKIVFTRKEMDLMCYLNQHADRPISREELLNKVWGYDKNCDIETRTVDIHIAKLRRKIEKNHKEPKNLITVRGAGYRLVLAGEVDGS